MESTKGANPYLKYVAVRPRAPTFYQQWKDPAIQKCVAAVHKAYPSDTITPPVNPTSPGAGSSTDTTYVSVVEACQYMALFDDIAERGREEPDGGELHQGGLCAEERRHPRHRAVSFGPGQPYATGPVTIFKYDPTSETLVPASS